MSRQFHQDGISFFCPDGWELEREESDSGWTMTLRSPGTAFAVVNLERGMRSTEDMAAEALDALRSEYPDLDAQKAIEPMAGDLAIGHDVEFFRYDLPVTAWTRCFYGPSGTVLVLCQVGGPDEDEYEPALRGICASLQAEE